MMQASILVFLGALLLASAGTLLKKVGNHEFPMETEHGEQTANEFQLINPKNIQTLKSDASLGVTYSVSIPGSLVINNDDVVTVNFQSSSPKSSDWIGAYSPANIDITTTVPIKYGYCDDSADYLTSGNGALTFNLTNLRADIAFYYFTNGVSSPVLVATAAEKVTFKNMNQPLRPRVVPTGDYNVYNLLWSSATSTTPILKWGTKSGVYTHTVKATTSSISPSDLCGSPAKDIGWRDLGLIHTASFVGMESLTNTQIYYTFGDDATQDFAAQEYIFTVPPLAGQQPAGRPTTVILYDDLGRGSTDMSYTWNEYGRPAIYTMQAVAEEIRQGKVDAIYHGGDISYATGYAAVWDFFLDELSPVASAVPYLLTVGNHEADWYNTSSYFGNSDSGGECSVPTTKLLPFPAPATTTAPWWSYKIGLFHLIGVSTEHDLRKGSPQYLWLEKDLQSVDRSKTPWVIFGAHRPMYINSNYGDDTNEASDIGFMDLMIANIEPLLFKYRVNLGVYGHNHAVQRHSAVFNSEVIQASVPIKDAKTGEVIHYQENPQATVHFVIGTGGAAFTQNGLTPPPSWNELTMYEYGYTRVMAVNATYLDWQWVKSTTGEVLDHVVLTQSDPTQGSWKTPSPVKKGTKKTA